MRTKEKELSRTFKSRFEFHRQEFDRKTLLNGNFSTWKEYPTQKFQDRRASGNLRNVLLKGWDN